jgi:hypothetical protein
MSDELQGPRSNGLLFGPLVRSDLKSVTTYLIAVLEHLLLTTHLQPMQYIQSLRVVYKDDTNAVSGEDINKGFGGMFHSYPFRRRTC